MSQSDVSVTEQSNEMSKTDAMSETELLTTDWERLDQSIFCFKILHKKRNSIINQAYLSDFQKRKQKKLSLRKKHR